MTSPPYIVVQLIHIHGGLKGKIQEFSQNLITVGRLSTCTIQFPADEPGVSREHARIVREGNQFKLIDLSKYGTSVNGKQVKEVFLRNGDVLEFGPGGPKVSFNMELLASPPEPILSPSPSKSSLSRDIASPVMELPRDVAPVMAENESVPVKRGVPAQAPVDYSPVQKTVVPLVIQFGPTIRTFRELPVSLGADTRADFVIRHPGLQALHAQIFYYQNNYWIKDLTGLGLIKVNHRRIDVQAQLNPQDEIECSPSGPSFRFLGEGRLAEIENEPDVKNNVSDEKAIDTSVKADDANIISKFIKGFRK